MHTITYVSTANHLFSQEELEALLEKSRENNARFDITGLLLYHNGNFIQTIEGPHKAITRLYSNICRDRTHHNVITLVNEPVIKRNFPDWQMGFFSLNHQELSTVKGFNGTFHKPIFANDISFGDSRAMQLLSTFRQTVR